MIDDSSNIVLEAVAEEIKEEVIDSSLEHLNEIKKNKKPKLDPDQIKASLLTKRKKETPISSRELLSSGCTLLDLQCTGKINGCYPKGCYIHVVGDSDAGKTFLALTAFGEASINKAFDDYLFDYYFGETGALMDRVGCFGACAAKRITDFRVSSPEEFYDMLDTRYKLGKPSISILDSMDSLMPLAEEEKFETDKEARAKGKETSGSFGMAKPKTNSALLRVAINRLVEKGSILIIISQTRDNIGFGAQFNPKGYSGGHALKFYSQLQIWVSSKGDIKKNVKGKERQVGINSKLHVKKNHITGHKGAVDLPIYHNPGAVDNIGSCIDYLVDEGHWSEARNVVVAPEFNFEGKIEKLAQKIDNEGLEKELKLIVSEVWHTIQEECVLQRRNKYQ